MRAVAPQALLSLLTLLSANAAEAAVGRIEAGFGVDAAGAAGYSIPILATEGIGALTPQLAIEYAGPRTRGVLGVGFALAGLSSIAACPRTLAQDGIAAPVVISSTDRYCLDGQRLRLVSGSYGASGSTYRTEIDTVALITARDTPANGVPGRFTLERSDGMIVEYGGSATQVNPNAVFLSGTYAGAPPQFWAVSMIRDRSGNSMSFVYENLTSEREFRLQRIDYTASALGAAHYSIEFEYSLPTRPDPVFETMPSGAGQATLIEERLLSAIALKHDGSAYRRYVLAYQGGAGTNSRLASVQLCNGDASDCLAATTIQWQSALAGHAAPGTATSVGGTGLRAIDVNGDGIDDLVWSNLTSWYYALGTTSGTFGTPINTGVAAGSALNPNQALTLDWDGDGRDDLLIYASDLKFRVLKGTASGFAAPVHAGPGAGIASDTPSSAFWTADLDGDGRGDLLRAVISGTAKLYVRYNSATGFGAETLAFEDAWLKFSTAPFGLPIETMASRSRRADFDGDGREDLVIQACEWDPEIPLCLPWRWYRFDNAYGGLQNFGSLPESVTNLRPLFAQLNADGLTDLVYPGIDAYKALISLGGDFALVNGPGLAGLYTAFARIADYDADGYDDLYVPSGSSPNLFFGIYRSTGVNLALGATASGIGLNGTSAWTTGEANGDSLDDVLRIDGVSSMRALLHAGPPGEQLLGATDGFGSAVAFGYLPMTSALIYAKGSGAQYPTQDLQGATSLVRTLTVTPGGAAAYVVTYNYASARRDARGRGYLGMGTRVSVDGRNTLRTSETYRQDFPYIGALAALSVTQPPGSPPITTATYSYAKHDLDITAYNQRYLPYRSQAVTFHYEYGGPLNGYVIRRDVETQSVSVYGNPTVATVTSQDQQIGSPTYGQLFTTQFASTYQDGVGAWCPNRALSRTETRTPPGGSASARGVAWTVDPATCRTTQMTLAPSQGALTLVTDLQYDACGNASSISQAPGNDPAAQRTTTLNHGLRCQWPETISNPLGQGSTLTYDATHGVPVTATDPNLLTSSVEYDAFARMTRLVRPDGTATRIARSECNAGNGWCGFSATDPDADELRVKLTITERTTADAVLRSAEQVLDSRGRLRYRREDSFESGLATVALTYDALDRLKSESQPYYSSGSVYKTQYNYDALDRLTSRIEPLNVGGGTRTTFWYYDGRDVTVVDPRLKIYVYNHDVLGRLLRLVDPAPGGMSTQSYHAFGELATITDPAGLTTAWSIDGRGRVIGSTDPDSGARSFVVNAFGELTSSTDAKNQTVTFQFDKLGRPVSRLEAEGSTDWIWGTSAASNNIGRLKSITSPGFAASYLYDAQARERRRDLTIDGATYRFDRTYDGTTGVLATLTYPTSTASYRLKLAFDYQMGELWKVRDGNASTVFWELDSTDALGHVQNERFGSGVLRYREYDQANGWLFKLQAGVGGGTALQNAEVLWDANGNLAQRKDWNQSITETITYDALNRLDYSQRNGSTNLDVTLSASGAFTSKSDVGSYTYQTGTRRVTAAGANTYGYDANGNVTTRNGSTISYASYDLPTLINAGTSSASFTYDAARQLIKQTAVSAGVTETTLYVDGLLEKVTEAGITEFRHRIPAPTGLAALYVRRSSGVHDTYYVLDDHLGSPSVITGSTGTELLKLSFDAYGARRDRDWAGPITATDLATLADLTRSGFTGHPQLDAVGLVHMGGRVYDPVLGRFISVDPLLEPGVSQSLHPYAYVLNNPLTWTDPSGFQAVSPEDPDGSSDVNGQVSTMPIRLTRDWLLAFAKRGLLPGARVAPPGWYFELDYATPNAAVKGAPSTGGRTFTGNCAFGDFAGDLRNAIREGIHDLPNISLSLEFQGAFGLDKTGEYSQYSFSLGINSLLQVFAQSQGSSTLQGEGDIAVISAGFNGGYALRSLDTGVVDVSVSAIYGYAGPGVSAGFERGIGSAGGSLPASAIPRGGRLATGVGLAAGYLTGTAREFTSSSSAFFGLIDRPGPYSGCGGQF